MSFLRRASRSRRLGTRGSWPLAILLSAVLAYVGCDYGAREGTDATRSASDSLTGVWELEVAETLAPDGSVMPRTIRESFLVFTPEHYSMNWAGGPDSVSSYEEPFRPTEEEALARYGSLLVNAGRYTASGGSLTIEPTFALVPEFVGGSGTFEYRFSGDTLGLRWTEIFAADGTPDPLTSQGYVFRYRFVRVD